MNASAAIPDSVVMALGWTLVHFLWQGGLVAALLAVVQKAVSRSSSNARYLAACGALACMLMLPVATFVQLQAKFASESVASAPHAATPATFDAAVASASTPDVASTRSTPVIEPAGNNHERSYTFTDDGLRHMTQRALDPPYTADGSAEPARRTSRAPSPTSPRAS